MTKLETFLHAWAESLGTLLSQLAGTDWAAQAVSVANDHPFCAAFRVHLAKGVEGDLDLLLAAADAGHLLSLFMGETVNVASKLDELQAEAALELLRQWAGLVSTQLKPVFGETEVSVAAADAAAGGAGMCQVLSVAGAGQTIQVGLQLSPELIGRFDRRARAAQTNPQMPADVNEVFKSGNLELLLDVELGVMLRFGCRHAALREVLELSAGAVLELDRDIHEPVDLLLNDRVIARGEVVVVDGNYGLRVTEVASPEQRLGSL